MPPRVGLVHAGDERGHAAAERVPSRAIDGHHEHVGRRAACQLRGPAAGVEDVPPLVPRQACGGRQMRPDPDVRMIHQVFADAGQVVHDGNTHLAQMASGADSCTQQDGRGVKRTGGNHDLTGGVLLEVALPAHLDPEGAAPVEQQAQQDGIRTERQVGPGPHCPVEIADRRRDAPVVLVGERQGEHAVIVIRVQVLAIAVAHVLECAVDGPAVPGPIPREHAPDRHGAVAAMLRPVTEIQVPLEALEAGEHVRPAPALEPHRLPFVIVGSKAAHRELAIDGRAAAHDPRLLQLGGRRRPGVVPWRARVDAQLRPMIARIEIGETRVAVGDHVGHSVGRRVGARLDEQHLVRRSRGQPRSQRAPRRASPDDDTVEVHAPRTRIGMAAGRRLQSAHGRSHDTLAVPLLVDWIHIS